MIVGIFRSRLREDAQGYAATAERMEALASAQPGFLGIKTFTADDGERVSLFAFESLAELEAWRDHPEHLEAQRRGREEFYAAYSLQVCELVREAQFGAADAGRG